MNGIIDIDLDITFTLQVGIGFDNNFILLMIILFVVPSRHQEEMHKSVCHVATTEKVQNTRNPRFQNPGSRSVKFEPSMYTHYRLHYLLSLQHVQQ